MTGSLLIHSHRHFLDLRHHSWMNVYDNIDNTPQAILYVIGNPIIAQSIMRHDFRSALNIPLRLLVLEKEDRSGTCVIYHLPSSVMNLTDNEELRRATQVLDEKLDTLVNHITAV